MTHTHTHNTRAKTMKCVRNIRTHTIVCLTLLLCVVVIPVVRAVDTNSEAHHKQHNKQQLGVGVVEEKLVSTHRSNSHFVEDTNGVSEEVEHEVVSRSLHTRGPPGACTTNCCWNGVW